MNSQKHNIEKIIKLIIPFLTKLNQEYHIAKKIIETLENILISLDDNNTDIAEILSYENKEPFPKLNQNNVDQIIDSVKRWLDNPYIEDEYIRYCHIFYNIIKMHLIINGNKRLATLVLFIILFILYLEEHSVNELEKKKQTLFSFNIIDLSVEVAQSSREDKEKMIDKIYKTVFKKIIRYL